MKALAVLGAFGAPLVLIYRQAGSWAPGTLSPVRMCPNGGARQFACRLRLYSSRFTQGWCDPQPYELLQAFAKKRPRSRLTIRQRTRVIAEWPK